MKPSIQFTLTAFAVVMVSACATRTEPPPALASAIATVRQAEATPNVASNAPLELRKATTSLRRAQTLNGEGEPLADVVSAAYVAERQALAAMALANAKTNEEGLKSAEAERERARADAREREANRARSQSQMAQQRAGIAEAQAANANAAAAAAQQNNVQLQQQASQLQAQAAQLQRELDAMNARKTDRGMLVTLGDVLFEFGRADIKAGAMESLVKLANFLKQHPERQVLIEGFTDSVGSNAANEALSRRRAQSVVNALVNLGVMADKIQSVGYGEEFPVADNNTDSNRALNRRVEVYISDNDQAVRPRRN
jgi:outer membrane protein OmpA-like peptidoglycan-associated protein